VAVMPIPDDWDGEQWCCHVVEWPSSEQWTAILLGLITTPQRGRFWDGRTGTITAAQAVGLQIFQRNLLEVCEMGCLEDLADAISTLALSISTSISNAGGCGCAGTGGSGTVTHFGIGTASSGAGKLLYSGTVTPNIVCGNGVTPSLVAATTSVTED